MKNKLSELAKQILDTGMSFDHPNLEKVDLLGGALGVDAMQSRRVFFAARDLATLRESEKLDGGSGLEVDKVDIEDLINTTFSKG